MTNVVRKTVVQLHPCPRIIAIRIIIAMQPCDKLPPSTDHAHTTAVAMPLRYAASPLLLPTP